MERALSYNNRSFNAFRLQCILLGKLANWHLYGAVSKDWSHLYLLKELTKLKTDTEIESLKESTSNEGTALKGKPNPISVHNL